MEEAIMFRLINTSAAMVIVLFCSGVKAQPGGSLFELHCASCHGNPPAGSRAPDRETMREFTPETGLRSVDDRCDVGGGAWIV